MITSEPSNLDVENNYEFQIKEYCNQIRRTIITQKDKTYLFKNFPSGCCRDSSIVLGEFLKEALKTNEIYICRKEEDGNFPSHAWLQFRDLVIDITGDQFHGFPPIIVSPINMGFEFHNPMASRKLCKFIEADSDAFNLLKDYQLILEGIRPFP